MSDVLFRRCLTTSSLSFLRYFSKTPLLVKSSCCGGTENIRFFQSSERPLRSVTVVTNTIRKMNKFVLVALLICICVTTVASKKKAKPPKSLIVAIYKHPGCTRCAPCFHRCLACTPCIHVKSKLCMPCNACKRCIPCLACLNWKDTQVAY